MRRLFYDGGVGLPASIGLLLLRLVVGSAFVLHGWPKIQAPFSWMPPQMGSVPGILQAVAALSEFGGGIALVLGLLTRPAALALAATMAVAACMVHIASGDPFVHPTGGRSWELAAVYFTCAVLLLITGPGRLSLDALLFGRRSEWPRE